MGSSCFARGNNANVEIIRDYIREKGIDAEVTFSGKLCEDMCSRGPVVCVDDRVYELVDPASLRKILKEEFE